jgi:hypothetical protein
LNAQKSITESDEAWLDGEGNPVDEERVVDLLENASDYDQGFSERSVRTQIRGNH